MYYSRQTRDLVVRLTEDPRIKGRIKDVVIDFPKAQIKGFWLEGIGLWKTPHFLGLDDILYISQNNVLINSTKNLPKAKNINKKELVSFWYGTPVYNSAGYDCGTLADILWEYPEGTILGFAVSQGVFRDFQKGWYFLPAHAVKMQSMDMDGLLLQDNFSYFYEVIRLNDETNEKKKTLLKPS